MDTNLWSYPRMLIQKLIDMGAALSFDAIWKLFKTSNDVDHIIKSYAIDQTKSLLGIEIIKLILRLRDGNHVLHIPAEVWYETVYGKSSRMDPKNNTQVPQQQSKVAEIIETKKQFFDALPVKKVIVKEILMEGIDFPKKIISLKSEELCSFQRNSTNLKTDAEKLEAYNNFTKRLQDLTTEQKKLEIMTAFIENLDTEEMRELKEHLKNTNLQKKELDNCPDLLPLIKQKGNAKDSVFSKAFAGKLKSLFCSRPPDIKTDEDVNKAIAYRLLMNNEELVYFDLQLYLYAKKTQARVITLNKKAFMEVNDPCFKDYFADVNIIIPQFNYSTETSSLNQPNNGCNCLQSAINFDEDRLRVVSSMII